MILAPRRPADLSAAGFHAKAASSKAWQIFKQACVLLTPQALEEFAEEEGSPAPNSVTLGTSDPGQSNLCSWMAEALVTTAFSFLHKAHPRGAPVSDQRCIPAAPQPLPQASGQNAFTSLAAWKLPTAQPQSSDLFASQIILQKGLLSHLFFVCLFVLFCFGYALAMWKFTGQGPNPCHSTNPSCFNDESEHLTH